MQNELGHGLQQLTDEELMQIDGGWCWKKFWEVSARVLTIAALVVVCL
ncbi:MAG: bacteriocin [Spirochaetes bacterium]|nr:bacteriocin [Spirochaetota bacterium]